MDCMISEKFYARRTSIRKSSDKASNSRRWIQVPKTGGASSSPTARSLTAFYSSERSLHFTNKVFICISVCVFTLLFFLFTYWTYFHIPNRRAFCYILSPYTILSQITCSLCCNFIHAFTYMWSRIPRLCFSHSFSNGTNANILQSFYGVYLVLVTYNCGYILFLSLLLVISMQYSIFCQSGSQVSHFSQLIKYSSVVHV